jgi:hypothetical protein
VVFDSFDNAIELSPRTLQLWAGVLLAVPGAMLLLKAPAFRVTGLQAQGSGRLAQVWMVPRSAWSSAARAVWPTWCELQMNHLSSKNFCTLAEPVERPPPGWAPCRAR